VNRRVEVQLSVSALQLEPEDPPLYKGYLNLVCSSKFKLLNKVRLNEKRAAQAETDRASAAWRT